jgi:hypothetical protein
MSMLRLFNAIEDRILVRDYLTTEKYALTELSSGDQLSIEYTLLKRAIEGGITAPWERVLSADYSLRIGLFLNSDRMQLAYQTTWTKPEATVTAGVLALDTAAINTLFTTATEAACTLEIEITDADGRDHTVYRNTGITLKKALIASANVSEQPGQTQATQEWVKNVFMPINGAGAATPRKEFYMLTEDDRPVVIRIGANNQILAEPY